MKVFRIVVLTLLICFLLFVASVYITFKYILTPERIKNYVRTYIETTISEQFEKYKKELFDKIFNSGFTLDKKQETETKEDNKLDENIESVEVLENFDEANSLAVKYTKMDVLEGVNDINKLTAEVFSDVSTKMEKLKYKIKDFFGQENKELQEE